MSESYFVRVSVIKYKSIKYLKLWFGENVVIIGYKHADLKTDRNTVLQHKVIIWYLKKSHDFAKSENLETKSYFIIKNTIFFVCFILFHCFLFHFVIFGGNQTFRQKHLSFLCWARWWEAHGLRFVFATSYFIDSIFTKKFSEILLF